MSQGLSLSRAFHRSTAMWPVRCRASSQTACGQTGSLSSCACSAPSFWKHLAHICLTIISRPLMFFVWGADLEHVPNWNSRHHHVPRFAVLPASPRRRGPLGLFSLALVPFLIPSRDPQSAFPGFSSTIFSTWSKFESQVASPDSILRMIAACRWRIFCHLTYWERYAVNLSISSLCLHSCLLVRSDKIISSSPATKSPNVKSLYSMSFPSQPHRNSCCNMVCG